MQKWIQWKKEHWILHCIMEMKPELLFDSIEAIVENLLYWMTLLQVPPFHFFSSLTENPKVQVLCSPSVTVIPCWSFVQLTRRKIGIIWETEKVTFYTLLTTAMEFNHVISCVSYTNIYVWFFYYSFDRMVWKIRKILPGPGTQALLHLVL